jgi:hypothetical protein
MAVPMVMIAVSVLTMCAFTNSKNILSTFPFLVGCGANIWLTVVVHVRVKNTAATIIVGVGLLLILLTALGVISPHDIASTLRTWFVRKVVGPDII